MSFWRHSLSEQSSAYSRAGVDIDKKYAAVKGATDAIRQTFTKGVVGDVGLFGGLFDLGAAGAEGQLLVSSMDGVGTKVKIAQMTGRLGGVGEDLVNHCVDDILVQGARPLFFMDYIAVDTMVPEQVHLVLQGLAKACKENHCALLGGETAEMPGVYREGEMDIAGNIIGSVAREKLLDGTRISAGDVLLCLPSVGLHTNGYSLARQICFADGGMSPDDKPEELGGASLADALLAVHQSYLNPLWPCLERGLIHGMAHITGGGLQDNVPRILPENVAVEIDKGSMPRPPIFDLLVSRGQVEEEEAYRVFNMGFGMVLSVAREDVAEVKKIVAANGDEAFEVGVVVKGAREVLLR